MVMLNQHNLLKSPLSFEDIATIDETGLSIVDRHHLRLLAHCLSCFKEMAKGSSVGALPSENVRLKWLLAQPALTNEREFAFVLLDQLAGVGLQLEKLAAACDISPLELTLEELINESLRSAQVSS